MKNVNNHVLRNIISTLIFTLFVCASMAQTSNLQKFVGVWSPTKHNGAFGNIKITVQDSRLFLKIKYLGGIREGYNIKVSGNSISWSIPDDEGTQYGEWYIQNGKIYKVNGGSNGEATNIYNRSGRAKIEINYISFRAKFTDSGDMTLDTAFGCDYCSSSGELLFDQFSNFIYYSDYSNW